MNDIIMASRFRFRFVLFVLVLTILREMFTVLLKEVSAKTPKHKGVVC